MRMNLDNQSNPNYEVEAYSLNLIVSLKPSMG